MNFDEIKKSMEKKLGKENSALIADDMASLITLNSEREKSLRSKDDEITKLKNDKETLITANGNLLQQVNQEKVEDFESEFLGKKKEEQPKEKYDFKSLFDEKGNFKK